MIALQTNAKSRNRSERERGGLSLGGGEGMQVTVPNVFKQLACGRVRDAQFAKVIFRDLSGGGLRPSTASTACRQQYAVNGSRRSH